MRVLLVILAACSCSGQELSKSIGMSATSDSGLQIWANSSAITTATVLGNAAVVLGGLFLLYNSDEVLAAADLLLPPNLKPVGLHHPAPELPKLPYSGVHPLPAFHPLPPPSAPIYVEDVKEVLGGVAGPWNLGHKVGKTWGKVKALTKNQMARMKALTHAQIDKMKALTRGRPGAIFNLASMANILPDSVNKVREAGNLPLRFRESMLSALRPALNAAHEKEAVEEFEMEEQEPEHKNLDLDVDIPMDMDMDLEEIPFLIFPRMKDRTSEEEEMVEEMVAPEDKKNNIPPATKDFEERFRDEDKELQELIEAHLSNFESFKIPKEIEEDSSGLGSDISATTVEIIFETSPEDDKTTTQMSVMEEERKGIIDEKREKEDFKEENINNGELKYETIRDEDNKKKDITSKDMNETKEEEKYTLNSSSRVLEEVLKNIRAEDDKVESVKKIEFLKDIAKAYLRRKYKKVKKPKQIH